MSPRANPYRAWDGWFWSDENDFAHGPYDTQMDALRGVLKHMSPTPWQRLKVALKNAFEYE